MKKVLSIIFACLLILSVFATISNASSTDKVVNYASQTFKIGGKDYKLPDDDVLRIQRYLNQYPVTDEQADQIIAKGKVIIGIMQEAGVSDPEKLSKDNKSKVYTIAKEAATIAGADLSYDSSTKSIEIRKNGEVFDKLLLDNSKLVQTGSNNTVMYVSIAVVAVIAIATGVVVYAKRKANA